MSIAAVPTPDGHLAVIADGRLTLYELEAGQRVASVEVVGDQVAACGSYLLVHAHDNLASLLTLFSVPDLTAVSCVELAAPTRFLAATGPFALVDRGDQAFIAQASGGNLAVVPLRPPATFDAAFGLDGGQFLTLGRRGTETWDATQRTATARLALALPDEARESGVTLRGSSLWVTTGQPMLTLLRLSDGRVTTLRLDAAPRQVRGHRAVGWVTAQVGADDLAINLAVRVIEPLERDHGPVIAVAPVRDRESAAVAVTLDGDRVRTQLLGADPTRTWSAPAAAVAVEPPRAPPPSTLTHAPVAEPRVEAAAPPAVAAEPAAWAARPQTVSERLAARLGRAAAPPPVAAPPVAAPPVAAPPVAAPPPPPAVTASPAPMAPPPVVAPVAPTAPAPTAPPPVAPPVPPAAPAAPPLPPAAPSPALAVRPRAARGAAAATDWRDALLAWADTPGAAAPALAGTALRGLHDRLDAGEAAWPILCALYAAWLVGDAVDGTPIARLVAAAGDAVDRWPEALGTRRLALTEVAVWDRGRARLTGAAGEFLDGRAPRELEVLISGPPRPTVPGLFRVDLAPDTTARHAALTLADRLGAVAWIDPPPARAAAALARARVEAWLRDLPLVTPHDVTGAELPRGQCVIWLARGAADHPAAPPRWPLL